MRIKIRILFILLILVGGVFLGTAWSPSPGGFIPYPYRFEPLELVGVNEASQSDVLIVGDRMGQRLAFYTRSWEERGKVKLYNWSETGEGLHRTLNKLRHLSSIPPIVIYHGGVDEFFEKKFHPAKHYQEIRRNLITYQKNRKTFWARQFPALAAFFLYSNSGWVSLEAKPTFNADQYEAGDKQRQMELVYHLFRMEFGELLSFFKEKKSTLIVVTPPLNLGMAPGAVCANALSAPLEIRQKRLERQLEQGSGEELLSAADQLVRDSPGNARSLYLRGLAYKGVGRLREAKASLYRAGAYDCDTSRGSIVFNKIMVMAAEKQNLTVIDFNSMVNNNFGEEGLFIENLFPKKDYYQQLIGRLEEMVRRTRL